MDSILAATTSSISPAHCRPKGVEVRCRLMCKGCYQDTVDKGGAYTSIPLLIILKLLRLIDLSRSSSFNFFPSPSTMYVI